MEFIEIIKLEILVAMRMQYNKMSDRIEDNIKRNLIRFLIKHLDGFYRNLHIRDFG